MTWSELLKTVLTYISDNWYSRRAIAVLAGVFVLGLFGIAARFFGIEAISIVYIATMVCAAPILAIAWGLSNRLPTTKPGHIGFVVALRTETYFEERKLRRDFVIELKQVLERSGQIAPFQLLDLPIHKARDITSHDAANRCIKACKAHFLIYGDVRTRNDGKGVYAVRLEGLVTHANIRQEVSGLVANEMRAVLPLRVNIPERQDLRGFEITTHVLGLSTKFIVATAALLSGGIEFAEKTLEELEATKYPSNLVKSRLVKKHIEALKRLIPIRLTDVYRVQWNRYFLAWRKSRDKSDLDFMFRYCEQFHRLSDNNADYLNMKAIYVFVRSRDANKALSILQSIQKPEANGSAARYGMAFLYAYQGRLSLAEQHYQIAFRHDKDCQTAFEVEEFIEWVLAEEPMRSQLHYCLGQINQFAKKVPALAMRDYERFVVSANRDEFSEQIRKAEKYLAETRSLMEAANDPQNNVTPLKVQSVRNFAQSKLSQQ